MISTLANLLNGNDALFKELARNFNTNSYFSPVVTIVVLLVFSHAAGLLIWIKWRNRMERSPDSRRLLARAADMLGLARPDCKLLVRMGREADFEPATALVSAGMLELLVDRWQDRFGELRPADTETIERIRKTIRASYSSLK